MSDERRTLGDSLADWGMALMPGKTRAEIAATMQQALDYHWNRKTPEARRQRYLELLWENAEYGYDRGWPTVLDDAEAIRSTHAEYWQARGRNIIGDT